MKENAHILDILYLKNQRSNKMSKCKNQKNIFALDWDKHALK
jgi:hypothetical protein